jgi:predicted RNase H-like nuclease
MPARAAVEAADYRQACALARATSSPPRALSRQGFMILPKVRAVDALLRARPELIPRVVEVHPELAFWSLNGGRALSLPKKVGGRPCEPGLALRRRLLGRAGLPPGVAEAPPPPGAGPDDLVDALAALVVALGIAEGRGRSFPQPPDRDRHGLPVAIWTLQIP